ncbi:DNA mismatch repair protein Mlh3 [Enoplosus armatus]|uniref:DNA mismatch repair protein Mlh3 n=1 Tax=Enoplosus armatus TaxID=215367 RepID=UPI0039930803
MIKCLPKEVQGKLRSGVAIPSLQQCVEELVLNSIDAEATCVGVRMDMEAFKVQVIDNGAGMNAEDMGCVGNRYYTSKCGSVEDLDNLSWYGFRGEAMASIVSLATLVEISSRTRSSVKTHVKIFKDGKGMDVFEAETARASAGTTVVICNFFHNMPVRRKRMDAVLEGERIRHRVEAISLVHPSVSFTLKNDCTGAMTVQLPKARNTYHRFVQIHSLGRAQKLGEISYTHGQFEVIGYIGREGHYNNSLQFLYVNDRLLLKTRIHKLLNFLLRRLSSSNQKNDSPEWQSAIRSPKHKRSQELHGVYIINIKCSYSEYDICLEPAKTLIEFKDWDGILLCIEEAVKVFLSRENLVAVSLCKESGSLEKFRRVYVFTKLKPLSRQIRGKTSLATKLYHLKQHRTDDSNVFPHLSRTSSQDNTCLSSGDDGVQDSNNNEDHYDTTLHPEPVPGCSTNPQLAEREEATTSGDWLHHYDTSVGKTVYVNKVTGLSRYEDPRAEETQVCCTSDVTNMAVSVISEMGMEYRCYPFQVALVLPFVPKSRTERVISSGLDDRGNGESSNSLTSLYSKWNNPVFVRPPMVGVDISSGQADGLAVKIHNILFPYRFSKAMIHSMKVIHQVDKKFLACLINTRDEEPASLADTEGNLLVLVDQHAAHERVRLENLVADSYEDDPDAPGERRLCSSTILPPLEISVTEEELRLLRSCQPHLRSLGLEVKFSQAAGPHVFVGKVPLCFIEKESNELRRGRASVIKPIVEEYLREQIELLCLTGRVKGTLPLTVLKVLASLACHGAIKFNDSLSRDECYSLVASLSSCQLPFQCAHGRPSIAPLVDILHLDKDQKELQKPNLQKLRRMYKAWELYGSK